MDASCQSQYLLSILHTVCVVSQVAPHTWQLSLTSLDFVGKINLSRKPCKSLVVIHRHEYIFASNGPFFVTGMSQWMRELSHAVASTIQDEGFGDGRGKTCTPLSGCPGSAPSSGSWAAPPGGRGTCGRVPPHILCWLLAGQESTAPPGGKSEISNLTRLRRRARLRGPDDLLVFWPAMKSPAACPWWWGRARPSTSSSPGRSPGGEDTAGRLPQSVEWTSRDSFCQTLKSSLTWANSPMVASTLMTTPGFGSGSFSLRMRALKENTATESRRYDDIKTLLINSDLQNARK